jgi:hypothetical protein
MNPRNSRINKTGETMLGVEKKEFYEDGEVWVEGEL